MGAVKAVYGLPCEFLQHCKGFGQELVALFKCQSCLLQGRLNMIELPHGLCVCIDTCTYDIYGGTPRGAAFSW